MEKEGAGGKVVSWLITGAVLLAGAVSAKAQKDAADYQSEQLKREAEQEKLSAEGRELERRQQLNKVLSANIISQAAGGISGEGTPASISLESAKQASASEGLISLSEKLKQAELKRRAQFTRRQGNLEATSTLLSSVGRAAQLGE